MLYRYDSIGKETASALGGGKASDFKDIIHSISGISTCEKETLELGIIICMNGITDEQRRTISEFKRWCENNRFQKFIIEFVNLPLATTFGMWYTITSLISEESVNIALGNVECCVIRIPINEKENFVKYAFEFLEKGIIV